MGLGFLILLVGVGGIAVIFAGVILGAFQNESSRHDSVPNEADFGSDWAFCDPEEWEGWDNDPDGFDCDGSGSDPGWSE